MPGPIGGIVFSPRLRFVFLHVPKTAGGSLKRALLAHCPDAVSPSEGAQFAQRVVSNRLTASFKNRLAPVIQSSVLKYLVTAGGHPTMALTLLSHPSFWRYRRFAFVRNPMDRVVSGYEYARQYRDYRQDFGAYVGSCGRHLQPQVNFLFFRHRLLVDWVGRFEQLEADLDYLGNWLEIPGLRLQLHHNRTERAPYEDYMTPSIRRRIAEIYQPDFAAFGYDGG